MNTENVKETRKTNYDFLKSANSKANPISEPVSEPLVSTERLECRVVATDVDGNAVINICLDGTPIATCTTNISLYDQAPVKDMGARLSYFVDKAAYKDQADAYRMFVDTNLPIDVHEADLIKSAIVMTLARYAHKMTYQQIIHIIDVFQLVDEVVM